MQKRFEAVLVTLRETSTPLYIRLPFDPRKAWPGHVPVHSALRVKGTIQVLTKGSRVKAAPDNDALTIAGLSLMRFDGEYWLMVTRKMQKGAGVVVGNRVAVAIEPDADTVLVLPPELAKLFKEDRSVKRWFDRLNYSNRKYIANNIGEPKSAEVRVRRAERWVERMMLTMEGEEVTPPILQMAFRRQPKAKEGWDAMTTKRRQLTLLSLFSCEGAEAREKRLEYAVNEMLKKAGVSGTGSARTLRDNADDPDVF